MRARFFTSAALFVLVVTGCAESPKAVILVDEAIEEVAFGISRPDATTTRQLTVTKPFVPDAIVTLIGATGGFAPAVGALPTNSGVGILFQLNVTFNPAGLVQLTGAGTTLAQGTLTLRYDQISEGDTTTRSEERTYSLETTIEDPAIVLDGDGDPADGDSTIAFGRTAIGETANKVIQVINPNQATPIRIVSAAVTSSTDDRIDINLTGLPIPLIIPPQESRRIPVEYAPQAGDDGVVSNATVTLQTAIGEGQLTGGQFFTQLTAQVSGEGMNGEVVLNEVFTDPLLPLDGAGETAEFKFTLPAEAVSIYIFAYDIFGDPIEILELIGPDNTILNDATFTGPWPWFGALPNGDTSSVYDNPIPVNALSTMLPNNDAADADLVPGGGEYCLRFSGTPGNLIDFRLVYEQRNAGSVSEGTLDLNILIPDGGALPFNAASAPTNPNLQAALAEADRILATAGIRLGAISYFDALGQPDNLPSFIDAENVNINAPFAAPGYTDANARRLDMYIANAIGGGDLPTAQLGISVALPAIPVSSLGAKTTFGGIAIQFGGTPSTRIGREMARRILNALGLFPTTIDGVTDNDDISDTLVCPITGTNQVCTVEGNNNLLHPVDLGDDGIIITPGQRRVAVRHPFLSPGRPPN